MQKRIRFFWIFSSAALFLSVGVGAWSATNHPQTSESRIGLTSLVTATSFNGIQIPAGQITTTFTSSILEPDLPGSFDVAGLEWQGDLPTGTHIEFWLEDENKQWLPAPLIGDESKEASPVNTYFTQPVTFSGDHTRFKLQLTRASAEDASPVVHDVQLITVDSGQTSPITRSLTSLNRLHDSSSLNIISRADWGADEAYRFTSDDEELWPADYATPTKFIIHHTAGSTGGDDPAATVRAIYYWHAVVLGWGDIGYNYLVDESGNTYEGRYGGSGVIGAHAYNDVREINYNEGSVGIALLGCYEADDDGACSSIATPSDKLLTALTRLVGTKGRTLGIRPKHSPTLFHDIEIRNVVGHRDVDYTLCPGSIVHDDLSQIRSLSQTVYNSLDPDFRAKFIESDLPASISSDTDFNLTTTWKNTGSSTWNQTSVYLKIYNGSASHPTPLRTADWTNAYGKIYPQETSVAPGETATFIIPLHTLAENATRKLVIKVFHRRDRVSTSTDPFKVHTLQPYAVSDFSLDHPVAVLASWRPQVTATATNTGSKKLPAGVKLLLDNQEVAETTSATAPGAQLNWTFTWTPPQTLGTSRLHWEIEHQRTIVPGSTLTTVVRVD